MKCPKCGFKNPETSQECLKCGIVFSKLKANPKNETKIYYRAEISHSETSFFHYMIWPIAWAKVLVGQVFNRIIEMIWRELIGDKTAYSQLTSLIAVFIFSAFSITIYRFRAYDDLIIFVLLLIWCIDYSVAKFLDLQGKKVERINLTRNNRGQLIYKRTNIDGEPEEMAFNGGEVNLITIDRDVRLGGAFKEVMGNLWRIRLSFTEGYNLLLDEQGSCRWHLLFLIYLCIRCSGRSLQPCTYPS